MEESWAKLPGEAPQVEAGQVEAGVEALQVEALQAEARERERSSREDPMSVPAPVNDVQKAYPTSAAVADT